MMPSVSSLGRWLVAECHNFQGDYIYMLEVDTGQERTINLGMCNINMDYELGFGFIREDSLWSIPCNDSGLYCFVQATDGNPDCKQLDLAYLSMISSSLDNSQIVLVQDGIPYLDGTVSGKSLLILERNCLFDDSDCKESKVFNLPYYKPLNSDEIRYPIIDTIWDSSGEKLMWLLAPVEYLGGAEGITQGYATSGVIDVANNSSQVLWDLLPKRTNLIDISPDNNWLLFSDPRGLFLGSIQTSSIRRLVTAESGVVKVIGWLIIP